MRILPFIGMVCVSLVNPVFNIWCEVKTSKHHGKLKTGHNVTLTCTVFMESPDELIWYQDHLNITHLATFDKNSTSSTIKFNSVTLKNSGKYECQVKKKNRLDWTCSSELKVYGPPTIRFSPRCHQYGTGVTFQLTCSADGYPKPDMKWIFNNKTVFDDHKYFHLEQLDDQRLALSMTTHHVFGGIYSCLASNTEGQARVDIPMKFEVPKFEATSKLLVADINKAITLECLIKNIDPDSCFSISWSHTESNRELTNHKMKVLPHRMAKTFLTIINATEANAGIYKCNAKHFSLKGKDHETTVVIRQPGLPSVTLNQYNVKKTQGEEVTLICTGKYTKFDNVQLEWIKNDFVISPTSQRYHISELSSTRNINNNVQEFSIALNIKNVTSSDAGNFTCVLMSEVKNSSVSAILSIDFSSQVVTGTLISDKLGAWEVVMVVIAICTTGGLITGITLRYIRRRASLRRPGKDRQTSFVYETFLTFSDEDYHWVQNKLIPLLEKYTVKYCMPHRDYEPGKALIENITDNIYQSRTIIAVMSAHFMTSKKCRDELDVALYRVAERNENCLIVIRVDSIEKQKLPKALRNRTFLDYTDKEERKHWKRRLLKQLFREHEALQPTV